MPTIRIPTPLRTYTGNNTEVYLQGETVDEALEDLVRKYPSLKPHLYNNNELRPFINLFLNEDNVRDLDGMNTNLADEDQLLLIPSIAGGIR